MTKNYSKSHNFGKFFWKTGFPCKNCNNFHENHRKFVKSHVTYLKLKKVLKKLKEFLKKLKKFCPKTQPFGGSRLAHPPKKCPKKKPVLYIVKKHNLSYSVLCCHFNSLLLITLALSLKKSSFSSEN